MNPEVQKFLDEHPGYATEGPDSNGITTYRAPSGDYITVRSNGSLAMRGFSPPADGSSPAPAATAPASAQPARGVGPTTKEALEARVGQTPGLVYQGQKLVTRVIKGLAGDKTVEVPVVTWINPTTGYTISAEVGEGGSSYTITADGVVEGNIQSGTTNPNSPEARNAAELQRQREQNAALPPDQDPAYETDAERRKRAQDRIEQQGRDAKAAEDRARQTRLDEESSATRASTERRAAAQEARLQEESKRPDTKVEQRPINGQLYIVSTTTPKDGSAPTIRYFGPDGAQISRLPSEGEASVGGPKMPQIIHNQAAQILTQIHNAAWDDPSRTPAQREKFFQEAVQIANIAVQQAATDQRERESSRQTAYNIASGKADYLRNGMQEAFKFASGLKGTDLGGKVFAAMLNLNLATLQASGVDDVMKQYAAPLPTITPADMRSSAAIDAKRAQIDQSITQSLGTPPFVQPDQPSVSAAAAAAPAPATTASPKPAAAAPPAAPPTLAPPVTSPVIEPPSKDHIPSLANPLPGGPVLPPGTVVPQPENPPQFSGYGPGQLDAPPFLNQATGDAALPVSVPDTGPLGSPLNPNMPVDVPYPSNDAAVSMMPHDFAALRPFGQPTPAAPAPQPMGTETPTALRLAQIAATPSWMMSEDDYNFAKQNGQEGLFWRRPGEAA